MWRRIVPVGMFVTPKWMDHGMDEKLKAEASGILNWAIEGLRYLLNNEMPNGQWAIPASVQATIDEYRSATDLIVQFASEEVEFKDESHVATVEVYQRYDAWKKDRGHRSEPLGPKFYQELRKIGLMLDKEYVNGSNHKEYLRGGKLRAGAFGTLVQAPVPNGNTKVGAN